MQMTLLAMDVSGWELTALVASIVSVIVGFLAIALTLTFFIKSNDAAGRIHLCVERMEAVFEKMFSGTSTQMSELTGRLADAALADKESGQKEADRKAEALRQEMMDEVQKLSSEQGITATTVGKLTELLDRTIKESRRMEMDAVAGSELAVANSVMRVLKDRTIAAFSDLAVASGAQDDSQLASALFQLSNMGKVRWDGRPTSPIRITEAGRQ